MISIAMDFWPGSQFQTWNEIHSCGVGLKSNQQAVGHLHNSVSHNSQAIITPVGTSYTPCLVDTIFFKNTGLTVFL